jgi:hypothetical protein
MDIIILRIIVPTILGTKRNADLSFSTIELANPGFESLLHLVMTKRKYICRQR